MECDCLGIASHNIGSSGATVTVSASDDGVTFTGVGVSVTPDNDDTIMVVFDLQEYRYWRVNIFDGPASVGVVKLGKRLVMPCGVLSGYTPINHAHDVELLTNMSVQGQFLGTRIKRVGASASIQFGLIDAEFVDEYMQDFEYYFNSGRAFFYAGSPDEWPDDYGYCWRSSGTLAPSLEEGGVLYSVSMEVSVYVEQ